MKKGFTLIELITVIILIAVIGLIVFPTVNSIIKKSEDDLYNEQIERIKDASEKWAYDNVDKLPNVNYGSITITLLNLKKGGYLPLDIKDPRTDEAIPNGLSIVITYIDNEYTFTIKDVITDTTYDENSPILILNGDIIEYVEINSEYVDNGVTATSAQGIPLSNITTTYIENNKEVSRIKTAELKTYTINYSVTDNGKTSIITRTVIIRDTIAPILNVPTHTTISQSEVEYYDLLTDVTVTDNSKENINIEVSSFDKKIGDNTITYKACDSSNNCTTVNRIITVE